MTRIPLLLVSLLICLPTLAQAVDVSVRVSAEPREPMLRANYGIHVEWNGGVVQGAVLTVDAPVSNLTVHQWDAGMACTTEGTRIRCTLPEVAEFRGGFYLATNPATPGLYTATATVTAATPDPNPANNTASATVETLRLPVLRAGAVSIDVERENAASPARPAELRAGVQNHGETATNVTMHVTLPEGGSFLRLEGYVGPPGECYVSPQAVDCRWAKIEFFQLMQFRLDYVAPDRDSGGTFPVRFEVDSAEGNASSGTNVLNVPLRKRFVVSSAADEGAGSLRQAILDANVSCAATPCYIALRSSEPIRPLTPLPELSGFVKVEGENTRAEIDGSLLTQGHGLAGNVCELRVLNVALRNFPGHAIEARQAEGCGHVRGGLQVRSTELTGNVRGIVTKRIAAAIDLNAILDNKRAGIYIDRSRDVDIHRNTISRNGASGIFVNLSDSALIYDVAEARIKNNVIRDNHEWGICRTAHGWVDIASNEIAGNLHYGIDVNLDFDTPNGVDTVGVPNKPVLLSATYDPAANQTILRAKLESHKTYGSLRIAVYASDALSRGGHPEAERQIYSNFVNKLGDVDIVLPGDHRGKWITALITHTAVFEWELIPSNTSEISNAVRAE